MFLGFLDATKILLMGIWTWMYCFIVNENYLSYQWFFSVLLSNVSLDIFMNWMNSNRGLSFSYIENAVSDHPRSELITFLTSVPGWKVENLADLTLKLEVSATYWL